MNTTHCPRVAAELSLSASQVAAVAKLVEEGGTVPFIARYRKEATGSLDEVAIAAIRDRLADLAELDKRRESMESIFDPFFTTKEGKGTGLGLSTSYSIIKSHQGDIRVTSALGKGTLFRIGLPVAPAPRDEAAGRPRKAVAAKRSGGDILVVDDEVHIQELLAEALEMHGYTAATCGSGEEALELLKTRRFSLMLLDIRMPSRSGLWLLAEIRRAALKMPVIVITGLATPEERDQALELGAARCFQKPFKVDELLDAVDATLRKQGRRGQPA